MSATLRREWPGALAAVVALMYAWVGSAAQDWDRIWGLGGAVVVLAGLVLARRSPRLGTGLLVVGALPLAISTWWSLVTPVLALVVLVLGALSARARARSRRTGSVTGQGGDLRPAERGPLPVPADGHAS